MDLNTLDKSQLIEHIKQLDAELAQLKTEQYGREFFASIIEHIPIPVAILRVPPPGQPACYVYQFVNTAVAKLNNKSVAQHIGHTLEEILGNAEVVAGIHANFESVISTGNTSVREIDIPIEGTMGRLIEYHFPIKQQGKVTAVGAALVDISQLSAALKEAETANQAKSTFLSQMSHEIRTPMNAIMGFAQVLARQGVQNTFSPKQMQCIDHILHSSQQLLHIIDDLLDLSRIEAGKMNVLVEDVDLSALMEDTVQSMSSIAQHSDISIIFQDKAQFRCVVRADKMRLTQVLLNLLSNAIKYNNVGGTVTLLAQTLPRQRLRIGVQDNGLGMSPEQQQDIFKPFERLGRENGPIPGSGIGLLISQKIMHALQGDIHFTSTLDKGSHFWIEIPLSPTSMTQVQPGLALTPPDKTLAAKNVLYVEDNPQDMMLMEMIFEKNLPDFRLILAPTAELGLELAHTHKPDIILLDIRLPGVSGLRLLHSLKAAADTRHCPIIAVTAEATKQDVNTGLAAGFHAYLTKPIDLDTLVATVLEAAP